MKRQCPPHPRARTSWAILLAAAVTLPGCMVRINSSQTIQGSGVATNETRQLTPFTKLKLSGAVQAEVQIGQPQRIEVEGDDNLVPLLLTEVRGNTLSIHFRPNTSISPKIPLKTILTVPELAEVRLSGACRATLSALHGEQAELHASGASKITAAGEVQKLQVSLSGASSLDASEVAAETVTADLSGASSATVQAHQALTGELTGASRLVYHGDPARVQVHTSGASTVRPR